MVDSNIKFSRADQLTQRLKERCSRLAVGEKFLSVRQIMDEFNVSQITVKQAIERLCESGVLEAQDRRGYFIQRNRRYGKIAALTPWNEGRDYYNDFRELLGREAAAAGFEYELFGYKDSEEALELLSSVKADAILYHPFTHEPVTATFLNRIMTIPVPVILVHTTLPVENCRFVDSDNEFCGLLAATHLMINGHRKLALFLSEPDLPIVRQRAAGFLKCAEAYQIEVEILNPKIRLAEHSPSRSGQFMEEYLSAHPRPDFTGLFVISEEPAYEIIRAIRSRGLSVPEDISLLSMGHSIHSYGIDITTINTRRDQVIHHAVKMVQEHFDNNSNAPGQFKVTPEINHGETVRNLNTNIRKEGAE